MSCGCGGGKAARQEMLRAVANAPVKGMWLLATYPDCTTPHLGEWRGESTYVVGRNTDDERLFRRVDLAAATEWAIATRQQLENIPNSGLCDQAVIDLYSTAGV